MTKSFFETIKGDDKIVKIISSIKCDLEQEQKREKRIKKLLFEKYEE